MNRHAHVLLLTFGFAACVTAEDISALQLFQKVSANYAALFHGTYDLEQVETREYPGPVENRTEIHRRIVGSGTAYRDQVLPLGPLYLFDGSHRWSHNPDRNEYTRAAGTVSGPPSLHFFEPNMYAVGGARYLRQETLQLDGSPVLCQVIEVDPASGSRFSEMTYWIDPTRYLILKVSYKSTFISPDRPAPSISSVTVSLAKAKLGQPIDASLLRFDPPPGAAEVQKLYFGGKSVLAGQSSPAFELKTTGGTLLTNATVKGTPVLLQFGHTWDDPGLLVLELMHRSLSSRGLLIYHVVPRDEGNPPGTVPVAYDPGGSVAREFGIITNGMVLLDRQGKIAYADAGSRSNVDLAKALQATGVW